METKTTAAKNTQTRPSQPNGDSLIFTCPPIKVQNGLQYHLSAYFSSFEHENNPELELIVLFVRQFQMMISFFGGYPSPTGFGQEP